MRMQFYNNVILAVKDKKVIFNHKWDWHLDDTECSLLLELFLFCFGDF